jgi:hypothetical protein
LLKNVFGKKRDDIHERNDSGDGLFVRALRLSVGFFKPEGIILELCMPCGSATAPHDPPNLNAQGSGTPFRAGAIPRVASSLWKSQAHGGNSSRPFGLRGLFKAKPHEGCFY